MRDPAVNVRSTPSFRQFWRPRYWPTWVGIGLLTLLAWMPWRLRDWAGTACGLAIYYLGSRRRYITRVNIQRCFPELSDEAQQALVKASFISNGIGLIETATGWFRPTRYFSDKVRFINLEAFKAAHARGQGVLLLGAHYSTLDLGSNLFSHVCPMAVTYRPHKNPLFDAFILRGRLKKCHGVFDKDDIRNAFRYLKRGGVLWYAPDQDYGLEHAVMAPFFGHPAATITAASRFASINHSPVFLTRQQRLPDRAGYEIEFIPLPDTYPSGNDHQDAALINRLLEAAIRQQPEQYLWMHKRFKSQPGGKPDSPYIEVSAAYRRLSRQQYDSLLSGAHLLPPTSDGRPRYQLSPPNDHLRLLCLPGSPGRLLRRWHLATRFNRMSTALRRQGLGCVTTDRLFQVPHLKTTLVMYYAAPGHSLARLLTQHKALPLAELGTFLARCHAHGFLLNPLRIDSLHVHGQEIILSNPHEVEQRPMALGEADRREQLALLESQLPELSSDDKQTLRAAYHEAEKIQPRAG